MKICNFGKRGCRNVNVAPFIIAIYPLTMSFVPWDTDMSMGLTWTDRIDFDVGISHDWHIERIEHEHMENHYPNLNGLMAEYWKKMRDDVYTEMNMRLILFDNIDRVCNSGAYFRDIQKWGINWKGADTHDALYNWVHDQLNVMDVRYG